MKNLIFGTMFMLIGAISFGKSIQSSVNPALIGKLGDFNCVATVKVTYYDSDGNVKGTKIAVAGGGDCAEATENAKNLL